MGVKIRISKGKIYLDMYHKGVRTWESLGLSVVDNKTQMKTIIRLAEIARSKKEAQLFSRDRDIIDSESGKLLFYNYMEDLASKKSEKHPIRRTLYHLGNYPGGMSVKLIQITPKWVEEFQKYLLEDIGIKKVTASNYDRAIRQTLNHAVRENILEKSPAENIKGIVAPESNKIYLTHDEVTLLAKTPIPGILGAEVKKAFLFACYTGLRVSDLKTLRWSDVGISQIAKKQEKTEYFVYIPIEESTRRIIEDASPHEQSELVFPRLAKVKNSIGKYLPAWSECSGVGKKIGWHTARHTFAIWLLECGADIQTVSKLMGHKSIKTTMVYAKITDRLKREAISRLKPININ